jgi:hypothetical protein
MRAAVLEEDRNLQTWKRVVELSLEVLLKQWSSFWHLFGTQVACVAIRMDKSTNWLDDLSESIRLRNEIECAPFETVYMAHKDLWERAGYLESLRVSAKHNIAIIQHEAGDLLNKADYETAVKVALRKLDNVASLLEPYGRSNGGPQNINLSKIIYDQRKQISTLEEELLMAKRQISDAFSSLASAQEREAKQLRTNEELATQLSHHQQRLLGQDALIERLQKENAELTARIITEKNKSAEQLDEMNRLLSKR